MQLFLALFESIARSASTHPIVKWCVRFFFFFLTAYFFLSCCWNLTRIYIQMSAFFFSCQSPEFQNKNVTWYLRKTVKPKLTFLLMGNNKSLWFCWFGKEAKLEVECLYIWVWLSLIGREQFMGWGKKLHLLFRSLDETAEILVDRISLIWMKCEDNFQRFLEESFFITETEYLYILSIPYYFRAGNLVGGKCVQSNCLWKFFT